MNILTKYLSCLCKFAFIALAIGAFSLTAYAGAEDMSSSAQLSSAQLSSAQLSSAQLSSASLDLSLQSSENEALQSLLPSACGSDVVAGADANYSPSKTWEIICNCCSAGQADCCIRCCGGTTCGNNRIPLPTDAT